MPYSISRSDCYNLNFPDDDLYEQYQKAERELALHFYKMIREKHGIWATNQNKFVGSLEELKQLDCTFMEDKLKEFENKDTNDRKVGKERMEHHNKLVEMEHGKFIGFGDEE
ncbi:MAG: hypothetical protein K0U20_09590 [Proteobacteria bacterium]|nr:hypothetical protein [Pseudomonadota bacterium]MCH9735834.1 hypothetical protein [Actinomycetes bacterium]